jgi:hypothetical protein
LCCGSIGLEALSFVPVAPSIKHYPRSRHRQSVGPGLRRRITILGLERRIAVPVANFHAVPYVVAKFDMMRVLSERLALHIAQNRSLGLFDLPIVGNVGHSANSPAREVSLRSTPERPRRRAPSTKPATTRAAAA